jgi:hypothetical protein
MHTAPGPGGVHVNIRAQMGGQSGPADQIVASQAWRGSMLCRWYSINIHQGGSQEMKSQT